MEPTSPRGRLRPVLVSGAAGLALVLMLAGYIASRVGQEYCCGLERSVEAEIETLSFALDAYALQNEGRYPADLGALIAPNAAGERLLNRTTVPRDPWNREYLYDPPTAGATRPRIYSLGADGKPGGTGIDADVDNTPHR